MANQKKQGRFLKENVNNRNTKSPQVPKKAPQKSPKTQATILVFTILAVCACLVASVFFLGNLGFSFKLPRRTIASDVQIAGLDVGGLTRKEAQEAVTAAVVPAYAAEPMVVTVLDQQLEIAPATADAVLDVEGVVNAAFEYGTEDNPAKKVDIAPYLTLNTDGILQKIREFAVNFPTEGEDGSYEIVKETVEDAETTVLTIQIGTVYYDFDANAMLDTVLSAYNNHRFATAYTCNQIIGDSVNLDTIYEENCKEAKDAYWDNENYVVVPSEAGIRFDLEAAKEALAAAQPGDTLTFPFEEVLPEVDTAAVEAMLYRDVLGTYTAKAGSSYNRNTNLRLACEAIDGTILYPGDVFGYNEALGERTAEKGYLPADSYMGSETVQTYGGGICQPSSSLYYCALIGDLEIVQRSNHGFVSSYMPYGMDATVDWKGPDFKFRNSTNYPIRIDAKADGGTVVVSLMGTDEKDYYVEMEYEILTVTSPKTVEEEVEPDSGHKDGEVKTSAYTGYTVQTYKLKYDKETDELISREKEAYSVYAKRDKVVYKVKVEETEPTEPSTEPTTPPTEAPTTQPTTPPTTPPSTDPTTPPTETPTQAPTEAPTQAPTEAPTQAPTEAPTQAPTEAPAPADPSIDQAGGDVALPGE